MAAFGRRLRCRLAFYCWPRSRAVLATPLHAAAARRVTGTPKSLLFSPHAPPRRRRRRTTLPAARFSDTHRRCVLSEHERATCHHEPAAAGRRPGTSGGTSESRAQGPPRTRGLNESNVLCRRGGFLGRVPRLQGGRTPAAAELSLLTVEPGGNDKTNCGRRRIAGAELCVSEPNLLCVLSAAGACWRRRPLPLDR
ncbi:hypothetical protein MTO96_013543 [Rhipicephalus appendiculatus]